MLITFSFYIFLCFWSLSLFILRLCWLQIIKIKQMKNNWMKALYIYNDFVLLVRFGSGWVTFSIGVGAGGH